MRVFELQHRPASGAAEMVRAVADDGTKVAAYGNTLVVNARPEELVEIARLVASYDRTRQMLRVTVDQGGRFDGHSREIAATGRFREGSLGAKLTGPERQEGGSLIIASGRDRLKIHAQDEQRLEDRRVSQFMSVLEGSPARISVGRSVPFTSELLVYWRRHPAYVETIEYQNVDTGFEILPKVVNQSVELEIAPFMAFLDKQNPDQIVFHEMAATLQIPFGVWYDLGSQISAQGGLGREILGASEQSLQSQHSIRVRVDPEM